MPTYVYRREDGSTFEVQQRITADPLETCPETGQPVTRLISGGAGLIFKGSGFYETDYVRNKSSNKTAATSSTSESSSSEAKTTEKSDNSSTSSEKESSSTEAA